MSRQSGARAEPGSAALWLSSIIAAYDSQGWHRTGTDVDRTSGAWLAREVRALGLTATLEEFPLSRIEIEAAFVEAGGLTVAGMPVFDGGFTGPEGVAGALGPLGSDAPIGFADGGPAAGERAVQVARRAGAHRAIVAVAGAGGEQPGLAPWNAADFRAPYGPPVVQISPEMGARLSATAAAGATARVVVTVQRTESTAENVVVHLPGSASAGGPQTRAEVAPLAVLTPRSGWWQCAAERGGGIAGWLFALRALATQKRARDVFFAATSGHELGHLGLDALLGTRPGVARTATWLHLGADIGAAGRPGIRLVASDEVIERLGTEALSAEQASPAATRHEGQPPGEARAIHKQGGRFLSLAGSSPHFHLESDRWPHAVDVDLLARQARAIARIATGLSEHG